MPSTDLKSVRSILHRSRRLLVITGAGVSTGSGIGDYRDRAGRWKRPPPITHQAFMESVQARRRYWARSQLGYPQFMRAAPNDAHRLLARWEAGGRVQGLITQNVDRLHQRAGHRAVLDLHGRLDRVVCMHCGAACDRHDVQHWLQAHNPALGSVSFESAPDGDADLADHDLASVRVPECQICGGVLKPDVVFFGDSVPRTVVDAAYAWVATADAVLVVGTSLMVYSSFRFVRRAYGRGVPIVAINQGATRADDLLMAKVDGDCAAILERLELDALAAGQNQQGVH